MAIDPTDIAILRELQADGRLTNNELANRVNLSPSPCLRRTRILEEQGYIQGYAAIIDQEKYGLPISVFVSVRLEKQNEAGLKAFEDAILEIDEIQECYLMTGSQDYLMRVVTDSLKSFEAIIKNKITRIPGIALIESSFALGIVKRSNQLPTPSKPHSS